MGKVLDWTLHYGPAMLNKMLTTMKDPEKVSHIAGGLC